MSICLSQSSHHPLVHGPGLQTSQRCQESNYIKSLHSLHLCSYDRIKTEPVIVDSIKHLDHQEQAEAIADKFAKVSQEYQHEQLKHKFKSTYHLLPLFYYCLYL